MVYNNYTDVECAMFVIRSSIFVIVVKTPGEKVCVCNDLGAFNMECDMQNIESRGEKECRNVWLSSKWVDL